MGTDLDEVGMLIVATMQNKSPPREEADKTPTRIDFPSWRRPSEPDG